MTAVAQAEYVEAEDVRRSPFRVAVTPLPSLGSALRDAAGAGRNATPEPWCDAIRRHLRAQDRDTLAPFLTSGQTVIPDPLVGLAGSPGETLRDGIERMMATPLEQLGEEIDECATVTGSAAWAEAQRDPGRWLRRYVGSLLRAWKGFGQVWRHARPAVDREVERVAMAAALDAQFELLDGLLAEGTNHDGRWSIPCDFAHGRVYFPRTGLVLTPLVAGENTSILAATDGVMESIAYPVRSVLALEPADPPPAALEGLLGIPRAQILRALGCPTSIGRLASALRAVPSAATHHVAALEAAGLVVRDRCGRNVLVRRTARAEALLELYDEVERGARVSEGRRPRRLRAVPPPRDLAS